MNRVNFRAPQITKFQLTELFGGPALVEDVKIFPDKNVSLRHTVLIFQGAQNGLSYGFVTMLSHEIAEQYIERIDNYEWFGQRPHVNWGTPTKSAAGTHSFGLR